MKKIFLIGKLNQVFEGINNYLSQDYSVQVCADNLEMIQGMLKLNQPDLIVYSMVGVEVGNLNIFFELKLNYSHVPVICYGSGSEFKCIGEIIKMEPFHLLERPAEGAKLVELIKELVPEDDAEEKAPALAEGVEKRKCVMLIDDNAFQIRVLNEVLKNRYDVQLATSGMKAMNLIGKRVPDIIFLDYDMPICDGKLTFQMIKELDDAKDVPVFFLTGVKDQEHIDAVMELNPAGYLFKPATAEMLYTCIEQYAR